LPPINFLQTEVKIALQETSLELKSRWHCTIENKNPLAISVILATQEMEIRRRSGGGFEASLGKMFTRPHLSQWMDPVMCACHPSYMGSINRRIIIQANPSIKQGLISKITNTNGWWSGSSIRVSA
jgi:hypothetical protein